MVKRKPVSTDGFTIPRRPAPSGTLHDTPPPPVSKQHERLVKPEKSATGNFAQELNASLNEIDKEDTPKKRRRWIPSKKKVKWFFIILAVLLVAILGYLGIKAFLASSKIFDGNLFDLLGAGQPLKMDKNGRSNIVLFGTSEDSGAHQDAGPHLTDSIMIISLDQNKNIAMMTSVPRDLWVEYGEACLSGYEGKVNAVYQCGSDDGKNEEAGAKMLMDTIGEVYGLDMHYYVHVNNTAVREAVDAVGGVDITIESDDPRGVYDPNFDWACGYECSYVKHPNGKVHLDGIHALYLARARDSTGQGYGLSGGNFAREQHQQKILMALRDKAASVGTLANPGKVGKLIDSLGNNVRTNFNTGEVKTLIKVAQKINDKSITTVRLDNEEDPQVTTGTAGGQSIVQPTLGLFDYSGIHAYIKKQLISDPAVKEAAKIDVLNGSGVEGAAQGEADKLTAEGLVVNSVGNAPEGTYNKISIYLTNENKPATKEKLEKMYGIKIQTTIPAGIESTADFILVVGSVE